MKKIVFILMFCFAFFPVFKASALEINEDFDRDGLTDEQELDIYNTNPNNQDSDNDGFYDGEEVKYNFDPNSALNDKLFKYIKISLKDQSLQYGLGPYVINTIKISTGIKKGSTPTGEFSILIKKPLVTYKGVGYFFPNTRWNMMFKKGSLGNLYIHGAYWHSKFGQPVSHGCVNASYLDMEPLYNWADNGTKVMIN